jgi:hypothetical protein
MECPNDDESDDSVFPTKDDSDDDIDHKVV